MPTTRPRHQITETEELGRAIDAAARRWPEVSTRAELLRRLVAEGHRAIVDDTQQRRERRRQVIRDTAGAGAGLYGPGYLDELREDWPE